ncbi:MULTISPECIES: ATP-binding protein [Nostocales]|uniref:histidine kinase n=3 Tax=Nostocales TaxID=1161 RepID=A0A8S9SZI1_9CYAN|nr:ATP-binding protein [Tolypothrix bouteillei]KAF3885246.1 GAF domain-containing protein [Tolypothrix bouteillei VB521301]
MSVLLGAVLGGLYYGKIRAERTAIKISEIRKIKMQARVIVGNFNLVLSDLMVLSEQIEFQEILQGTNEQNSTLAEEFFSFSQHKKIYDKIRFLDTTGQEIVRVDFNSDRPNIIPQKQLQFQLKRYWFYETLGLNKGEVFVSPLDLNIEGEKVEQPLKPIIRFGTPVFDERGKKRGIIILNYFGKKLLDSFVQVSYGTPGQSMLLNADGYWLKGATKSDEWGFMFLDRQNHTFGKVFPEVWKQVSQRESGQLQTSEGLFTYTTVYPLLEGQIPNTGSRQALTSAKGQINPRSYYWKIVSQVPIEAFDLRSNGLLLELLYLYIGLVGATGIGSWILAKASVHRQMTEIELTKSQARLLELAERENLLKRCLSSQIRNSLELDKILSTAVAEVHKLLQIERCQFLWCYIEDKSSRFELSHEACRGDSLTPLGSSPIEKVEMLSQAIIQEKFLQLDNVLTDARLDSASKDFLQSLGLTSLVAVAIYTHSNRLGVLVCQQTKDVRIWSNNEVELILGVADQLAIAIDQAELYNQSRAATEAATIQAEKLTKALLQLQQTQAQLIQTEKMSSLGQVVAGIAHEINNPVNFIYGNLNHIKQDIQHLLELIKLYQNSYIIPTPEIQAYLESIDLDFIAEDLPKMITSMKMGSDRIRQIVMSLRNFARLEEAEIKSVNIHEGIDSSLLILQHRLQEKSPKLQIEIIKYYSNLPKVECYPGQLNQVFMNLLNNAIDAIEALLLMLPLSTNKQGQIVICTEMSDSKNISVKIKDNGVGMNEEVKKRIFDPFFTTKPIGKGTGLGLSISYQIITEKHHGTIECLSEQGKGTEFWIKLPVQQNG